MGTISKNFSYREFEASKTADKMGITNVITSFEVRDNIRALVLFVLQPLRDKVGVPLHINSGFRCPELNKAVGGVQTSQHVKGEAADVSGLDPLTLARMVWGMGLPFDQMILYPDFVHISHKWNGIQRGQILYNWRYKGERV